MYKKDFLEQKYCEINQLKNLLQTYPKEYCETIIKVKIGRASCRERV